MYDVQAATNPSRRSGWTTVNDEQQLTDDMHSFASDVDTMQHAICIARAGFGHVEPNPMVGAVIVSLDRELIAEGFHQKFGGPHAEINVMQSAGERTRGADLFVSLEPCSHFGKTPPCADAVIQAGFRRVVIGCPDPAPHVAGQGIKRLRESGLKAVVGVCESEAKRLIAPFEMLMLGQRPWVHAKWAMTLDGRIASRTGHSKWISCEQSRAWVHDLRGRVDAIITGSGTVRADDPMLTARPDGPRKALRVVIDSTGESVTRESQLARTARDVGVLVCVSGSCSPERIKALGALGVETFRTAEPGFVDIAAVLTELARHRFTNVLLESGPGLLGAFSDAGLIDEIHAFIAPKLVGGVAATPAIGGLGQPSIPQIASLSNFRSRQIGEDLLVEGDVKPRHPACPGG